MTKRYLIYGRSSCPFCIMACDYLSAKEKDYIFFDLINDLDFLESAKQFYSHETVPIVVQNNCDSGQTKLLGGYTDLLDQEDDFL